MIVVVSFDMINIKLTCILIPRIIKHFKRWRKVHRPERFLAATNVAVVISATRRLQVSKTALLQILISNECNHLLICEGWVGIQLMICRDEWNFQNNYHKCDTIPVSKDWRKVCPLLPLPTARYSYDCSHALASICQTCCQRLCVENDRTIAAFSSHSIVLNFILDFNACHRFSRKKFFLVLEMLEKFWIP